jgi:hypothetical protein
MTFKRKKQRREPKEKGKENCQEKHKRKKEKCFALLLCKCVYRYSEQQNETMKP